MKKLFKNGVIVDKTKTSKEDVLVVKMCIRDRNIDEGYVVKSVIVDGVYREDLKNVQGSQDFNSIKANHSVYVYVETKDNSSNNKPANNLTVSTETVGKGSITPTAAVSYTHLKR